MAGGETLGSSDTSQSTTNTSDLELETEIVAKGLTAPRLTPQSIDDVISYSDFFRVANTTCTVCTIVLKNGYVVVGKSAAVSMANFDEEIGNKVAFEDARNQIWALEGYLLKDKLKQN